MRLCPARNALNHQVQRLRQPCSNVSKRLLRLKRPIRRAQSPSASPTAQRNEERAEAQIEPHIPEAQSTQRSRAAPRRSNSDRPDRAEFCRRGVKLEAHQLWLSQGMLLSVRFCADQRSDRALRALRCQSRVQRRVHLLGLLRGAGPTGEQHQCDDRKTPRKTNKTINPISVAPLA